MAIARRTSTSSPQTLSRRSSDVAADTGAIDAPDFPASADTGGDADHAGVVGRRLASIEKVLGKLGSVPQLLEALKDEQQQQLRQMNECLMQMQLSLEPNRARAGSDRDRDRDSRVSVVSSMPPSRRPSIVGSSHLGVASHSLHGFPSFRAGAKKRNSVFSSCSLASAPVCSNLPLIPVGVAIDRGDDRADSKGRLGSSESMNSASSSPRVANAKAAAAILHDTGGNSPPILVNHLLSRTEENAAEEEAFDTLSKGQGLPIVVPVPEKSGLNCSEGSAQSHGVRLTQMTRPYTSKSGATTRMTLSSGADRDSRPQSEVALAKLRQLVRDKPIAPGCVFCPAHPARLAWDTAVLLATVLTGVLVPLGLVYLDEDALFSGNFGAFMHLTDCIWVADVVLNFRTGYAGTGSDTVMVPSRIALRYARGWFLLDLLAALPVVLFAPRPDQRGAARVFRWLKLVRLPRIVPLIAHLQKHLRLPKLTQLKVGLFVVILCHLLSCTWRLAQREDGMDSDGIPWADLYVKDAYYVVMTMTTVGYGDICPTGTKTRLYALCAMFMAPIFSGTIVSALTHITRSLFDNHVEERVAEVAKFMSLRRVPADIQRRVQVNLRLKLKGGEPTAMDPELFGALSPSMQRELSLALLGSVVLQFPLFKGAQHSFVAELAQAQSWVQCLPGDLVAEEGQLVQELVFVLQGRLAVQFTPCIAVTASGRASSSSQHEAPLAREFELDAGAWFGEACLFEERSICNATFVAMTEVELSVMPACDYRRIVQKYPRLLERHQNIEQAIRGGQIGKDELAYHPPRPNLTRSTAAPGISRFFGPSEAPSDGPVVSTAASVFGGFFRGMRSRKVEDYPEFTSDLNPVPDNGPI